MDLKKAFERYFKGRFRYLIILILDSCRLQPHSECGERLLLLGLLLLHVEGAKPVPQGVRPHAQLRVLGILDHEGEHFENIKFVLFATLYSLGL